MSTGITLHEAISEFSRELGCSGEFDRDYLLRQVRCAMEHLLVNGGGDILREWHIGVRSGRFTFPRDLETPIKYKFSKLPRHVDNSSLDLFCLEPINQRHSQLRS